MIKFYIKYLYIFIFLLTGSLAYGQNLVKGTIIDGEFQEPLIGATVQVKGTTNGVITDVMGEFELEVDNTLDTLQVSFIGYTTKDIPLNGSLVVYEVLDVQANTLDELIVVGYGTQKKREVTGATSRVTAEEINSTPVLRIEQALQGRTAGVQVSNQSGQPGEEPSVRIRGTGTTGNAKPLYIVDGLPVSGIDYLNPGDIESMDVLKDAASAAIYGSRAANGVVLITTKTGSEGNSTVSYSGYYGQQNVARKIDMLNAQQYRELMNEGARNSGLSEPFDLNEIPANDTDWQEALFGQNVPMQNHQLSFTGGNKKSTYASSLSYFAQDGIIGQEKSKFERYTARINSKHEINPILDIGNNLAYTHLESRGIGSNTSFNGAYSSALNLDPLTPVFETDEAILAQEPYSTEPVVRDNMGRVYGISNNVGAEVVNPLALIETLNSETRKDQIVGNIYAAIKPIKGLEFRTSAGIDFAYLLTDGNRPLFYLNGAQLNVDDASVNKRIERFFTWQWENTVSYTKDVGDHGFSLLLGTTASEFNYEDISGFNTGVEINGPGRVFLNEATDTLWDSRGGAANSALYSLFGRLNYNFNNKYSVSAVVRRDGSSRFGANRRFGVFPSIGVAWVLSEETFLRNKSGIDFLKLRASWGLNGNQEIGDYQFVSVIDKTRGYTFGQGRAIGSSPLYLENADIGWEESEQYNIGLDLGVLNNRLQIVMDFYLKNTNDLLERIAIPAHVGNEGPIANVGSVQNKGIELGINWKNVSGDWKYSFGINGAYNKNTMTEIGNAEGVITGASWAIAGPVTRSEEGLPIAYFWGYETDGIFQNEAEVFQHINSEGALLQERAVPGDVRFVDVNGDGRISEADRTQIGNPQPDVTFGINAAVEFKSFDFSVFVQGSYGNDVFNGTQRQDLRFTNRTTKALDRWQGEGTSDEIPRYAWIDRNNNYRVSDLYVEDASFARVKNIQLGYTLPSRILDKLGAKDWRFYISAENFFTFTSYTGVDPEIGAVTSFNNGTFSAFDVGIDRAVYPQARTIRFGTSVTF